MGGPSAALVELANVGYRYPDAQGLALEGLSLSIGRGEILGVVGPTGAGKSTLCRMLNGIVPQFHGGELFGAVTVAGRDTLDTPTAELARVVGMCFEDPESQITATSVELEIAFALENLGYPTDEIRRRTDAAIDATGLSGLARRHPANLSGGQKQRLAIASAVALAPELVVLDEPTSQLDPEGAAEVFALLARLNARDGLTVVVASHATEELAEVSHRTVLLDGGRLVREGPSADVLGDVEALASRRVRAPDIARCFAALEARGVVATGPRPVTLEAARDRFPEAASVVPSPPPPEPAAPSEPSPRPGASRDPVGRASSSRRVALLADGLRHVYPDGTVALDGLDLAIGSGEFVALCGHNGSGKSTLVKHFLHLLEASAGRVEVDGENVSGMRVPELARRIGYVAQNAHQHIFADSVGDEVAFAPRLLGADDAEARRTAAEALETMRLGEALDSHPMTLSRGDRLRVAIAAVLALDPPILVFDEPTTGQDWAGAAAVMGILDELNAAGRTVVVITHHLYLLPGFARRLVVLDAGRVALDAPLREGFHDAAGLERANLRAPQTIGFAAAMPALMRAGHRPLSPEELAACFEPSRPTVAEAVP